MEKRTAESLGAWNITLLWNREGANGRHYNLGSLDVFFLCLLVLDSDNPALIRDTPSCCLDGTAKFDMTNDIVFLGHGAKVGLDLILQRKFLTPIWIKLEGVAIEMTCYVTSTARVCIDEPPEISEISKDTAHALQCY